MSLLLGEVSCHPKFASVPRRREYLPEFRYPLGSFPEGAVAEGD